MQRETKKGVTVMRNAAFSIRKYLKSRIAVFLVSIMLLVTMLLSVIFIAAEFEHDCTGDDCPICACIYQCQKSLSLLSTGCTAVFSFTISYVCVTFLIKVIECIFRSVTLITQKVRLND